MPILCCWERLRGEGIVGQGEIPLHWASKEQNSHPNSGVLPSVKSQGWGNFLAIRRLVKIHLGVQTSSNYLGGLADNRHSSTACPLWNSLRRLRGTSPTAEASSTVASASTSLGIHVFPEWRLPRDSCFPRVEHLSGDTGEP